jgi:NAD-dependent SIR2 family protein deacetylase
MKLLKYWYRYTGTVFIPFVIVCLGYVKPDIVFFGENLPAKFFDEAEMSSLFADFLICVGTSLEVYPFAGKKKNYRNYFVTKVWWLYYLSRYLDKAD